MKRAASNVIKRPKVIGNIEEITASKGIKRPKIIGNFEEPKDNRIIEIPKAVKVDDKRNRYLNLILNALLCAKTSLLICVT